MAQQNSIIQYIGPSGGGSCGYCKGSEKSNYRDNEASSNQSSRNNSTLKNEGPSISFGVVAGKLSPGHFNEFLDLGWSRSGKYLYKPIMDQTCCPQYTIRLDVHKFRLSRTQKRVLKTMQEYLQFDKKPVLKTKSNVEFNYDNIQQEPPKKKEKAAENSHKNIKSGNLIEKKKVMRKRRALEKLRKKGINIEEYQRQRAAKEENRRRTIDSYLSSALNELGWKHKLEIRLVRKDTPEFEKSFEESFNLYCKYQNTIHNDKEYTSSGYENFLVNTPLIMEDEVPGAPALGSYHQQYLIDGKIVAVGVIDLMPNCLSSKYFYYDPDFNFLTLGTYSALREILFTQELSKTRSELHYYYMGYFLINCPKMRYKGRFRPSDLLCDQSYQWVPLSECEPMILSNGGKFTVFRPDISAPPIQDIRITRCIYKRTITTYGSIRKYLDAPEEWDRRMTEYNRYIRRLSQRVLLCL